ncbi:MAG: hypothetical protein JO256_11620 [Alphaproteobacteria bacterium]|nr:hypothetical protein [Alphaproteobacteria bacterium]
MNQYEIRILRHNNQPLVISSRFLGDFHAIRRGQAMAEEDEGVEIWRGMKCLYRRDPLPRQQTSAIGWAPLQQPAGA